MFMHWVLGEDKEYKEVDVGVASSCQCLLLNFEGLQSKESGHEVLVV